MSEEELRRAAWAAAFFGVPSDHYSKVYVSDVQTSVANATIIRDEAAREYEYMQRTLEALDNKGAVALAASLALVTYAGASDGRVGVRLAVLVLAGLAGVICGAMIVPEKVRGVRTLSMARRHGREPSATLTLQFGLQYMDAVEATRLPALVKAYRLRIAMLLLFIAAVAVFLI